jgi:polyhydroxyalkanoate synthesis regulator phasin
MNSYKNEKGKIIPKLIINLDKLNEFRTKNEVNILNNKIYELLKKIRKLENEVIILYN